MFALETFRCNISNVPIHRISILCESFGPSMCNKVLILIFENYNNSSRKTSMNRTRCIHSCYWHRQFSVGLTDWLTGWLNVWLYSNYPTSRIQKRSRILCLTKAGSATQHPWNTSRWTTNLEFEVTHNDWADDEPFFALGILIANYWCWC